jgi:hypothetical protein
MRKPAQLSIKSLVDGDSTAVLVVFRWLKKARPPPSRMATMQFPPMKAQQSSIYRIWELAIPKVR